jgi:nucleoside-diphosphate-sugar epimerase
MVQERPHGKGRPLGRVLVTGAAGFLGSAVVKRLISDGEDVAGSDLAQETTANALQICDLTRQDEVEHLLRDRPVDTIIHAGAVSGPMVMADRPLEIWQINVTGTVHLLQAALLNNVGRFVLCSSVDVYGSDPVGPIDEDSPFAPQSVYGASKVAAEAALAGYACQHGIDGVAVRLAWIYGPGRRTPTTLERLIRAGLADEAVALDHHAMEPTHYLFIDDAIAGLLAAAKAPGGLPRRAYNISAGEPATMGGVVETLKSVLPALRVTFGRESPPDTGAASFTLTNAIRDLHYCPQVTLSDGLRQYVAAIAAERQDGKVGSAGRI